MSNKQLRGEIEHQTVKASKAGQYEGVAIATVLKIIFDNNKYTNPRSKVEAYLR